MVQKTYAKVLTHPETCKSECRRTCVEGWSKRHRISVEFKFSLTFENVANVKKCKRKAEKCKKKI